MRGKAKHRTEEELEHDIKTLTKVCKVCGVRKSFDFFTKQTKAPDLKANTCTSCLQDYRVSVKDRQAKWAKEYNKNNRDRIRYKHLYDKYGVTKEWYFEQLEKQDHKCAICSCLEPKGNGNVHFHVDHCHSTGKVRGLLCSSCNTALGKFKDSTELMLKAIEYINNLDKEI
jgi:hypothetical protein